MAPRLRLILSVLALLAVFLVGTLGYLVVEKQQAPSVLDAAYMTAITLSTVGYSEAWELSDAGRLWTVAVIIFGIATVSIAFTSLITLFVSGDLLLLRERRIMEKTLQGLRNHVILCGYGRMGKLIADTLRQRGIELAVIEFKPENENDLRDAGIPYLIDDATEEDALLKAGFMHARAMISALRHDADNLFATLTARTLRPDITIIARAEQPNTEEKLRRAGATRVVCPQVIGATRVVNVLTRPNVVDFIEIASHGVDLEMDEYRVGENSPLVGKTLHDSGVREKTAAIVVAIKRADGQTLFNPSPDVVLQANDILILIGTSGVSNALDSLDGGIGAPEA